MELKPHCFVRLQKPSILALLVPATSSLTHHVSSISSTRSQQHGRCRSLEYLAVYQTARSSGHLQLMLFYTGWRLSILNPTLAVNETRTVVKYVGWNRTAVLN